MTYKPAWSSEAERVLRDCISLGMSGLQTSKALAEAGFAFSRQACIAKARRLKLKFQQQACWPNEAKLSLLECISQGQSALETSKKLAEVGFSFSRSACIGKAQRLHRRFTPKQRKKAPENKPSRPAFSPLPEPVVSAKIHILALRPNHCRAVITLNPPIFCGNETPLGKSFCPAHMALYYRPSPPLPPKKYYPKRRS